MCQCTKGKKKGMDLLLPILHFEHDTTDDFAGFETFVSSEKSESVSKKR